jgi:hypothetical protein
VNVSTQFQKLASQTASGGVLDSDSFTVSSRRGHATPLQGHSTSADFFGQRPRLFDNFSANQVYAAAIRRRPDSGAPRSLNQPPFLSRQNRDNGPEKRRNIKPKKDLSVLSSCREKSLSRHVATQTTARHTNENSPAHWRRAVRLGVFLSRGKAAQAEGRR